MTRKFFPLILEADYPLFRDYRPTGELPADHQEWSSMQAARINKLRKTGVNVIFIHISFAEFKTQMDVLRVPKIGVAELEAYAEECGTRPGFK